MKLYEDECASKPSTYWLCMRDDGLRSITFFKSTSRLLRVHLSGAFKIESNKHTRKIRRYEYLNLPAGPTPTQRRREVFGYQGVLWAE